MIKPTWLDRAIGWISPGWAQSRARSRLVARHFEAASSGRRTDGWHRKATDPNAAASGPTLSLLRAQARDLVRNNPWARRGLRRLTSGIVGYGIRPKAKGRGADIAMRAFETWGETTECDAAGRLTFYGIQRLCMRTIAESGEVLIRRRWRRPTDGLAVPMQLQVLEPDLIDSGRDGIRLPNGGKIIQGIELDAIGRRVAYWLFDEHPGGRSIFSTASRRIPAENVLHVYDQERAGQVRGPSWFASVDVRLHDFDEYEDATLIKQKVAACMAAFVTDLDGSGAPLGEGGTDLPSGQLTDTIEPGMIIPLAVGKTVTVSQPPAANDHASFSATSLRGVAAGLGVTYEDLTGDYSQVTYSSARMARLAHQPDVDDWRWNMLIPLFCAPAWRWMLEALAMAGEDVELAQAEWTPPATPLLDPDAEGTAYQRLVRDGFMTWPQVIRELGYDPRAQLKEIEETNTALDKGKIVLDCDPRRTSGAGQLQMSGASGGAPAKAPAAPADGDAVARDAAAMAEAEPKAKPPNETTSTPAPKAAATAAAPKVFAYHQPFMKVKEIRANIELTEPVPDQDLFAGEFLAKHGTAASPDGGDDPTGA